MGQLFLCVNYNINDTKQREYYSFISYLPATPSASYGGILQYSIHGNTEDDGCYGKIISIATIVCLCKLCKLMIQNKGSSVLLTKSSASYISILQYSTHGNMKMMVAMVICMSITSCY